MKKRYYFFIVIALLAIDQITKYLVSSNMVLYQEIPIIKNFFSLLYIRNDGAAFSMLGGQTWLFYIVTIIALIIVCFLYKSSDKKISLIATSILLAGILGNFIDRLLYKEVIDFFSFTFGSYNFAVFNVADSYIVIAIILFLIDTIFLEKRVK